MTLFRYALLTACATFVLLLIGGTVHPTGSSLACPDWPLCYGELMPEMTGGVLFEHSHRLAATAVALLTAGLGFMLWRARKRDACLSVLGVLACVAILTQATLGGITVIFKLPTLVSTAHLALALGFFLLVLTIAMTLKAGGTQRAGGGAPRALALVLVLLCYAQVVIGGLLRHTGATFACGTDFPTCGGEWWPELWAARLNMVHRYAGAALLPTLIVGGVVLARRALRAGLPLARAAALAAPVLALAQVGLGILTVLSGVGLWQVLAHFAVGLSIVACLWLVYLGLGPLGARLAAMAPARAESESRLPEGVAS